MHFLLCDLQERKRELNGKCTAKKKPSVLNHPTLTVRRKQAHTSPFFFTCEQKKRVMRHTGKVPQGVEARTTRMHREHSAYLDPTCALRASFV